MSDSGQQNTESNVITENTGVSFNSDSKNKARERKAKPAIQKVQSLPRVRKRKIHKVRQQLAEGIYDIDKRLNVVIDLLLEDILK